MLFNPQNQGYGGNQKLGYHYAIERGYDFVALIHGDGQYAPECLPELLEPLRTGEAAAVFGSRMMTPSGRATRRDAALQVRRQQDPDLDRKQAAAAPVSASFIRDTGFTRQERWRQFRSTAIRTDFHFDTEIIIQLVIAGLPIRELPIPTYYGDEICYVNGMKYAFNVVAAATQGAAAERGPVLRPQVRLRSLRHAALRSEVQLHQPAYAGV